MLARTADHLYWMARFIERAESLARILDAHYRHSLLPHPPSAIVRDWRDTLSSLGVLDAFLERHDKVTPARAFAYLIFDRENGASIVSCLRQARDNARAVRGTITSEMWETLNSTWIETRVYESRGDTDIGEFLEWVRYRAHLSRGVTLGTMLRDEGFRFARIGTFLESADATARMLLARSKQCSHPSDEPASPDAYAWTLLLRSLSAFEVYRKVYRDAVTPWRVTQLLLLRADLPRSIVRCTSEVYEHLSEVANDHSGETERRAGELQSRFHFGRLEHLLEPGFGPFLEEFLDQIRDLGDRIAQDFLVPTTPHRAS